MKRTFCILLMVIVAASCKQGAETNPEMEKLKAENAELRSTGGEKDSALTALVQSLNEIQDNLDVVKEKEKILSLKTKDTEFQKTQQEQIVEDIRTISELMAKNRQKLSWLNKKLKKSNLKVEELEKMIQRLSRQIEEKDAEIASLKDELSKVNTALKDLFTEYNQRVEELGNATDKLNAAYYAFGTFKELKEQGIVTKEGGFIGIGRAEKLVQDFKKEYFTRMDIQNTTSITLKAKKAKVITTHPSGSYKFEGSQGTVEKLVITNPEEFWSASKYLVVVVE